MSHTVREKWSWSLSWDWSTRYCTNRRERPSLLDLLSEFGLISDGWLGSISPLEIGPMHLSVEGLIPWDWSYPVMQYLREWPTPTVTGTVVKPQQPPCRIQQCMCSVSCSSLQLLKFFVSSISSAINAQNASLRSLVAESIASVQQIQQMHNAQSTAPWKQRKVSDL